ncbi:hypothetical protein Pmani_038694 [Petrolisthes manimaculis]|uniref:Uncharacterized protein n=1 Tax=Petrolisthes manimaculis TaxID=1843537 RepID=A0AAE1NE61_9EUCA|nr:hypothetical protein Pmani_038694 [Petrolisthes manimaculis]
MPKSPPPHSLPLPDHTCSIQQPLITPPPCLLSHHTSQVLPLTYLPSSLTPNPPFPSHHPCPSPYLPPLLITPQPTNHVFPLPHIPYTSSPSIPNPTSSSPPPSPPPNPFSPSSHTPNPASLTTRPKPLMQSLLFRGLISCIRGPK